MEQVRVWGTSMHRRCRWQTNCKADAHTGYKTGFLLGRMTRKRGLWIKVEVGMGPYRVESVAIKTSIFKAH